MYVLTYFHENASKTGVLADRAAALFCDIVVFDDPVQNFLCLRPGFGNSEILDALLHVSGKVAVCLDTQILDHVSDLLCLDFSHDVSS